MVPGNYDIDLVIYSKGTMPSRCSALVVCIMNDIVIILSTDVKAEDVYRNDGFHQWIGLDCAMVNAL